LTKSTEVIYEFIYYKMHCHDLRFQFIMQNSCRNTVITKTNIVNL